METECIGKQFELQGIAGRSVIVKNDGDAYSSDGGLVLLSLVEKRYRIVERLARAFKDIRNPRLIIHTLKNLLTQRILGLCQGYEDINDHDRWRLDPLLALICGSEPGGRPLAGKGTLNRLELGAEANVAKTRYKNIRYIDRDIRKQLIELFIQTYPCGQRGPLEIIIDVDATDDPLHGNQEGRYFSGFYNEYCYTPLYLFAGDFPLWAELRTADTDPAAGVVLAFTEVIGSIRKRWPRTRIIIRGDSGFNRPDILDWCEKQENVFYVIGMARNKRLVRAIGQAMETARKRFKKTNEAQREFRELVYKTTKSWNHPRRVVAKAEYIDGKENPRFIVTNLDGEVEGWEAQALYEKLYCARGDMENRIKEQKLFLFADRLSSHTIRANQLRLYFSTFAYLFMLFIRRQGYGDKELSRAQASTIRLRLLKVAARVSVSVRRIVIHIPEAFPYWGVWWKLQRRLLV